MSYYRRFGFVLKNPIFHWYIRNAYHQGITNLKNLGFTPNFGKEGFTALLCGVGNEGTADEFIKFNIEENPTAKVRIIDFGQEQVEAVQRLVKERYPNRDIEVRQMNALDLATYLPPTSLDWIETDFLFSFLDSLSLKRLLGIWYKLLRPDGFATHRNFAPTNRLGEIMTAWILFKGELWLGNKFYLHTQKELEGLSSGAQFVFTESPTFLPFSRSFTLVKVK